MKKLYLILVPLLVSCTSSPVRKELSLLDEEIERIPFYTKKFTDSCDSLRTCLDRASSDAERFRLSMELYNAYSPCNIDSAVQYAARLEEYAGKDVSEKAIAASCHALCRIKQTDYAAASSYLSPIPEDSLSLQAMPYYYRAVNWLNSVIRKDDVDRWEPVLKYWQKDSTSADALIAMGNYLSSIKQYDEAVRRFDQAIAAGDSYYYQATANMFKSNVFRATGDTDRRIHFLIISAIADIRNNAKEYESLFILARLLNREKDYFHAMKYIQLTVEDAVAANYTVRTAAAVQASKIYHESFIATQNQKHRTQMIFIIILSTLLLLLFTLMVVINSSNRKLSSSRKALAERTLIQNKFLGEYMELSSRYIDEVDRTRSNLRKVLRKDGVEELSKILRAPSFADNEIKKYYANFDNTFLTVFPDFKARVAELIGSEPAAKEKNNDGRMSVSLRILALIRLGITDQQRISNVLHISSWTVYSYLYRMRKASGLDPKAFTEKIQSLCRI